jgi:O-antigen ligase
VGGAVGFGNVNRVRVAGTFAFVSGFASYLLAGALLIGAVLAARGWRIRDNIALYGALALVVAAMFATGSRGPVYSLVAAAGVYVLFSIARGDLAVDAGMRALVATAVLGLGLWYFLPEPADAFRYRAAGADDTLSRLVSPLVEPFRIFDEAGVFGFGIGAAHQSAAFLVGSAHSWWTNGLVAEAESSRVMLELGIVGFLLVFLFRVLITLAALRAAFTLKSPPARTLALILALYLGLQIFGAVVFNPTSDLLYWFAVGLLFTLHRFQAREARAPRAPRAIPQLQLQRSV